VLASWKDRYLPTGARRLAAPASAASREQSLETPSSGDEFVPLADHVVVLVHHGIPAGDGTHAVVIGAAVADRAGLLEACAIRRRDVAAGLLSFHQGAPPICRPFCPRGGSYC